MIQIVLKIVQGGAAGCAGVLAADGLNAVAPAFSTALEVVELVVVVVAVGVAGAVVAGGSC